jgi:hypothetical protein
VVLNIIEISKNEFELNTSARRRSNSIRDLRQID